MPLKLAYNTNGFAHHSLDSTLEVLAELGYEGVAIALDVHHLNPYEVSVRELLSLRRRLESLGLDVVIETGARFLLDSRRKHYPGLLSAEGWERRVHFLVRALEIASELGASVVTFASGVLEPDVSPEDAFGHLVERSAMLAERAAHLGLVASFEPEPGFFVETLDQYRRLREAVPGQGFGLTLDLGHVHLIETASIEDCIREWAGDLRQIHLEDMRRPEHLHLALGEGEMEFPPLMAALAEVGYAGLVTLELSRDSHRAPEVAEAAIERLRPLVGA